MEKYVWISKVVHHPVFTSRAHPILDRLAAQYNVQMSFEGSEDAATEPYVQAVYDAIESQVAGIMVIGWGDDEIVPAIDAAIDRGIPVVTLDCDVPRSKRLAHIGTDWFRMGAAMADDLARLVDRRGEVLMIGMVNLDNMQAGFRGFQQQMSTYPQIKIIGTEDDLDAGTERAEFIVTRYLAAHPDLAGIAGFDGNSGPGASRAIQQLNRLKQVKLVCVDADSAQVEFIKSGAIDAAFCQKREVFTYLAFQMLYSYNHGSETTGFTPGAINIRGDIDTGFLVVTKENVDSFNTELSIEEAFQQHELSQQLSLLSSMIENIEELALATDEKGRIVYVNPATKRLCGYDKSELLGASVEKIFNFTGEQKNQISQSLEQSSAKNFETAAICIDGSLFPVQISISPLRSTTNIRGLVIIAINISERKEAEAALFQSEERFRQMAEAIQEVFWMRTPNFREIVYVNPAFEKIWGQPRQHLYDSADAFIDAIHPEDRMRVLAKIRNAPKENWDVEYRILQPDGSVRWIRDRGLPIRDENGKITMFTGVALDMTQRKRSQMALIESHERFLTVLDSIDADIYVADIETYEILLMNKHMRDSFGEDLIGKPCWKVLRNEPGPCSICRNTQLLGPEDKPAGVHVWEGKNPITGKRYINYDRAIKWVDGRLVHLQIATDISRIKDLEKESLRIQAQLQQAQKMEAIGTLAGGIAHDFNNILSAVLGYTEIAQADAAKDSSLERNLKEVLKAGNRARDLVKQILTFSRQTEQELKPVQVRSIIVESLKLLRASLPTTLRIQSNIDCDSAVLADPTQIHQVLMNLCTNAAHAMRESGGLLKVDLSEVVLDTDFRNNSQDISPGSYVKLTVSDTGHGMADSIQERIFDPFFTTKDRGEGTGMGLAVVLGIVKSHGGAITMESHIGLGSTFNVFLPHIQAEVEVKPMLQTAIPTGTEHVLFVDDELALVDLGKKILERLGYHVTTRTSSIEALELFIEQPDKFDLIITDMTMPNMTGDELASRLLEVRQDIAIILCTGYSERISREKAQRMGIKEFILKPLVMSELGRIIRTVLDGDAQNRDSGAALPLRWPAERR